MPKPIRTSEVARWLAYLHRLTHTLMTLPGMARTVSGTATNGDKHDGSATYNNVLQAVSRLGKQREYKEGNGASAIKAKM